MRLGVLGIYLRLAERRIECLEGVEPALLELSTPRDIICVQHIIRDLVQMIQGKKPDVWLFHKGMHLARRGVDVGLRGDTGAGTAERAWEAVEAHLSEDRTDSENEGQARPSVFLSSSE